MPDLLKPSLRCNGIPITLSAAQPVQVSYDETAMVTERSARGVLAPSRRNLTRAVTVKTAPLTWTDAYAVRALVEGQGAACSFDASPFALNRALNGTVSGSGSLSASSSLYLSPPASLLSSGAAQLSWAASAISAWLASSLGVTIAFWMRCTTDAAYPLVTLSKAGATDAGIAVSRTTGNGVTLTYPAIGAASGTVAANADWHMVTAVVRDTTAARYPALSLYLDGVLAGSLAAAGTGFAYPVRDTLTVGPTASAAALSLDDLVVYPFPLTPAQCQGLYLSQSINAASSAGPTSPAPREQQTARYLPQVWLSGDGIGDAMLAVGRVVGSQIQAAHRDPVTGELLTNGMTLDLAFFEAGAPR